MTSSKFLCFFLCLTFLFVGAANEETSWSERNYKVSCHPAEAISSIKYKDNGYNNLDLSIQCVGVTSSCKEVSGGIFKCEFFKIYPVVFWPDASLRPRLVQLFVIKRTQQILSLHYLSSQRHSGPNSVHKLVGSACRFIWVTTVAISGVCSGLACDT